MHSVPWAVLSVMGFAITCVVALSSGNREIEACSTTPAEVIGTGGQARIIAPLTDVFTEIDEWLNLEGLRIIAERNR